MKPSFNFVARSAALALAGALLSGCTTAALMADRFVAPALDRALPRPVTAATLPTEAPDTMRWLYGSGEAAALSIQTFRAIADYGVRVAASDPVDSVILADGASPDAPRFVPCGDKPKAALFDADGTLLLNLGYEYWQASTGKSYDAAIWDEWERTGYDAVRPVPGAVTALNRLRAAGITILFNTNRNAANAAGTERALVNAGLGPAVHRETLFLKGDTPGGSAKDPRRALIAERYCVIAMAGDNLGDFSDLFNASGQPSGKRRTQAGTGAPAQMLWGQGWFVLPNPVYGASLAGDLNDTFPLDVRWEPGANSDVQDAR